MMSKRSFFRRVAAVVAAVALAPEIAFNAKLPLPEPELMPYAWDDQQGRIRWIHWREAKPGIFEQLRSA